MSAEETDPDNLKIGIVGFTGTRQMAPFDDPTWDLWGMNNLHLQPDIDVDKFAAWYDLHPQDLIEQDPAHVSWLETAPLPVHTWMADERWPTTVAFPRLEIEKIFGRYFTNSVSWMIAHAITVLTSRTDLPQNCEIGVWGIDMATDSEYGSQRPSCEYMIGIAQGMGIKVVIPDQSDLLKSSVQYGVDQSPLRAKLTHRAKEMAQQKHHLEQQKAQAEAQLSQIVAHINQMDGAIQSNKYILDVWTMPEVVRNDPSLSTDQE